MSRCCCRSSYSCGPVAPMAPIAPVQRECGCGSTYGGCNFACFIILILILLTFANYSNNNCCGSDGMNNGGGFGGNFNDNYGGIGKGLLFVIALYYLSCWIPCGRGAGAY